MKHQSLRQVFKITQWKNGCVFKTKHVGYAWVTLNHTPSHDGNLQFHSISTGLSSKLGHKSMRRVDDNVPDMDITTLEQLGVK